jgi:phospho-N-acetylmuramoyl-pentapeptide-transferase
MILINLKLLPGFISREKKEGAYRIEDMRRMDPVSTKLPHSGGIAVLIGFTITLLVSSNLGLVSASFRWFLLPIWGFSIAGLLDDIRKTQGTGISQRTKLIFVASFSFLLTLVLYFRFGFNSPYTPYNQVSYFLIPAIWFIWFVIMSVTITTTTTLATGFSDGMDGLLAGLWLIAALAYATFSTIHQAVISSVISFALVGAAASFLLFNLPSAWAAGKPRTLRRARLYLGETGSMMVGSTFAFLAILSQTELTWAVIGGVFVLEGATAFYQAKMLTPFFRRFLTLPRHIHNGNGHSFPHTEFPLPFLSTPYHCHLDLLGLGRLKIVYMFWALGLMLAVLGVTSVLVNELFAKVVIWLTGVSLIAAFWIFGVWTKSVFLGFYKSNDGKILLSVKRGKPYKLFGRKIYWNEEITELREVDLEQFGFLLDIVFWKPVSKAEALMIIGYLYYQLGNCEKALAYWHRIPDQTFRIKGEMYKLYVLAQQTFTIESKTLQQGVEFKEEELLTSMIT